MIQIVDNQLQLNDDTCYDLTNTSKQRVLQGLKFQLEEGSLTELEYIQCIELIGV